MKDKKKIKTGVGDRTFWERNRLTNGYLLQKRVGAVFISITRAILLFGLCFLILQPVLNKISVSFMTEQDLYNPIVISIPLHPTIENYQISAEIMNYSKGIVNSLVISLSIAIIQVCMTTLVGYGFARFKFPLKNMWFAFVMMLILVPPQTISSSLYLHFSTFDILGIIKMITGHTLNLRGSALPYFLMSLGCMGLKNGLYIYLVRQYFRNIPIDLEEAAYIDGCGTLKTFFSIMLPQAKPIITSCFLFAFVWQWTDGFFSRLFLGKMTLVSTSLSTIVDSLGVFIARMEGTGGTVAATVSVARSNQILSTGTLMIVGPIIMLYLFAQRQFVESLASTGIKM
ncbi:MAG: carbohydrate ABC transporter permease [Lachnospiraceae bacterium]|nr:carbohydrate ABC transporter permease [Lachnospiraceae bacterium]